MLTDEKDQFYFAPMEGITGYLFRNEFHRQFDTNHEITKYFGPFVAATREGRDEIERSEGCGSTE